MCSVTMRAKLFLWSMLAIFLAIGIAKKLYERPVDMPVYAQIQPALRTPAMQGKARSILTASIQSPVNLGQNRYTLTGRVSAKRALGEVEIDWNLPESVQLTKGEVKHTHLDLESGDQVEIEIEVEASSKADLKKVYLSAFSYINGVKMGHTGTLGSYRPSLSAAGGLKLTEKDKKRLRMLRE